MPQGDAPTPWREADSTACWAPEIADRQPALADLLGEEPVPLSEGDGGREDLSGGLPRIGAGAVALASVGIAQRQFGSRIGRGVYGVGKHACEFLQAHPAAEEGRPLLEGVDEGSRGHEA